MTPFYNFTDEDLQAIVEYIKLLIEIDQRNKKISKI